MMNLGGATVNNMEQLDFEELMMNTIVLTLSTEPATRPHLSSL